MEAEMISSAERRRKPRMDDPILVSIRGADLNGERYRFETIVRDIGAGGLCAYAPRLMQTGEAIAMRIRFVSPGSRAVQAPEVSVRGMVVRVNQRPGGHCMFAASFLLRRVD
jgi:hypothetical protein